MTNQSKKIRDKLLSYKFEFDMIEKIPCTEQENDEYKKYLEANGALPEGVFTYEDAEGNKTSKYYTIVPLDLNKEEVQEYLTYRKLSLIKTIKNCVVFMTVIIIISLIFILILFLKMNNILNSR